MKTISFSLGGKNYDISLEEDFANHLEKIITRFYVEHRQGDIKAFLSFFIENMYENFLVEQSSLELITNIKESLK